MLIPYYSKAFEKDLKLMIRRGKDIEKIKAVIRVLIGEDSLEARHRDHKLAGNYKDRRECHVEPDWLLIYKKSGITIVFERTGTHADLFE